MEIAIFHDKSMKKTARFSKVKLTVDQLRDGTMYKLRGLWPLLIFFKKILNSKYIFKILENKTKKNYICLLSGKLYLTLLTSNPNFVPGNLQ